MAMVGVVSGSLYRRTHSLSRLDWSWVGRCPVTQRGINPLMGTLKPQRNGPLYTNVVIGTLSVDVWAVTFCTARRGLGRLRHCPVPSSLYQM